jgi:hypothetical protein
MRAVASVAALALLLLVSGCTYSMHEVEASGYAAVPTGGPPRQAERIQAQTWQHVILGVTDNTDYVDQAYASLLSQCPGEIVGLNTRYSTSLSFLSYKNVVQMRAMCLRDVPPPPTGPGPGAPQGPATAPGP